MLWPATRRRTSDNYIVKPRAALGLYDQLHQHLGAALSRHHLDRHTV